MLRRAFFRLLPAAVLVPRIVRADTYLTVEQAQRQLFPGQKLTPANATLTKEQAKAIEKASDVRVRSQEIRAWRSGDGGWFIVDNVVGKHEFIDFALAITAGGAVKGVEVLVYRETYGHEIRQPKWMAQFLGKKAGDPVKVDKDIKNISGATLSSVHISEGVRRLLHTHAIALKS